MPPEILIGVFITLALPNPISFHGTEVTEYLVPFSSIVTPTFVILIGKYLVDKGTASGLVKSDVSGYPTNSSFNKKLAFVYVG